MRTLSHKKEADRLRTQRAMDHLRWENAKELGMTDETRGELSLLSIRDNFQATGQVKDRLKAAEDELAREGARKAELNLEKGPQRKK